MFSVCLHLQRRQLSMQTDKVAPSPSSSSGGEPRTAVTVSDSDKCTLRVTTEVCRWATAARADSTLCCKDRSLFTTGRDAFTNHSEIHFSHFPLSYTHAGLISAVHLAGEKNCRLCSSCCSGIALMSGKHWRRLYRMHMWRSFLARILWRATSRGQTQTWASSQTR